MVDFFRGVSSFFGPTLIDDVAYDEHYDEFDRRDEECFGDSYVDSCRAECHRYELREEAPRGAAGASSCEKNYRHGKLRSVARTKGPEQVFIKPENGFQDKYSKAPDIGSHFHDGDIITFDPSEFDPSEAKCYVDLVAGLVLGLRGRIRADGSVFTLYSHGRDVNESQSDRMSD